MFNHRFARAACLLSLLLAVALHGATPVLAEAPPISEEKLWDVAKDGALAPTLELYLELFPEGPHAQEAKQKLAALKQRGVDAAVAANSNVVEIRARHILVKTEAEAKSIIEQLRGGADFARLAESNSIDPGTAKLGGDLYWFDRTLMIKEFSDAAFALKPGEFSQTPVKSQWGYYVIKVEEAHTLPPQ